MAQFASYSGYIGGGTGGGGTVTNVTASGPLASSGGATPNISLTGTVPIANGGTGQTTAPNAINALLPSQATHAGEFLTTDGSVASWAAVTAPTGLPDSVAFFNSLGNLDSNNEVSFLPAYTPQVVGFPIRGFFGESDIINSFLGVTAFSTTDTSTDSFTSPILVTTGSNTTVGAANSTGLMLIGTGNVPDGTSTAATGELNIVSGNNNGSGASGNVIILSGTTAGGTSGNVSIRSGSSGLLTGSVGLESAGGPVETGDVIIGTGNAGSSTSGDVAIRTGLSSSSSSGNISAITGDSPEDSGTLELRTGNSGTGFSSGTINATTGTTDDFPSGGMTFRTGGSSSGNTGALLFGSGNSTSGNSGGVAFFSGLSDSGNSGFASLATSPSVTGSTGDAVVRTGDITDIGAATNTGQAALTTGANSGTGNSGPIVLTTGTVAGPGLRGQIQFVDGTEGTAGDVWTSTDVNGNGAWAPAGGGGANIFLSNLDPLTAINSALAPNTDGILDLGSSGLAWGGLYVYNILDVTNIRAMSAFSRVLYDSAGSDALNFSSPTEIVVSADFRNLNNLASNLGSATNRWLTLFAGNIQDGASVIAMDITNRLLVNAGGATLVDFSGSVTDFQGNQISNVADPTLAQDVATKAYVDAATSGGANTSLSNLTTTSINAALLPSSDNGQNLGSPSLRWLAYITTIFDASNNSVFNGDVRNLYKAGGTSILDFSGDFVIKADTYGNTDLLYSLGTTTKRWSQVVTDKLVIPVSGGGTGAGTAVLVGGTVTVTNTSITANSQIFLTSQVDGGTVGFLRITAKTVATSFVITSSSILDTSTVAWMIVEMP